MRTLAPFVRMMDNISERLGWLSTMIVIATVAVGFYNVAARYLGRFIGVQLSSNVFIEMQWYMYSLVFFFGFAYLLKNGGNVRVDFIYADWPKKRKARLDFWGHLLFLVPFCLLGIYVTYNPILTSWGLQANGTWGAWEMSPDAGGLPRAPIKTMMIVAFTVLLFQTFAELIKLLAILRDEEDQLGFEQVESDAPLRIE